MKDRVNKPTDGGWCDILFLFSIGGTNGHVCEVQVAFKSMISARKVFFLSSARVFVCPPMQPTHIVTASQGALVDC
jgi:hypothetical protein